MIADPSEPSDGPIFQRQTSLATDTAVRAIVNICAVGFGLIGAVVVSRWLGPSGKGVYSSLTLLGGLAGRLSGMSLGEASVVLGRDPRFRGLNVTSATMGTLLAWGWTGLAAFVPVAWLQFREDSRIDIGAVAIVAATIPLLALGDALSQSFNARGRLGVSSFAFVLNSGSSLMLLVGLVAVMDLGVRGALLASLVSSLVGAAFLLVMSAGCFSVRPSFDRVYARAAGTLGARLEVSYLLVAAAGRIDLFLVYAIAGPAAAGLYSIALTSMNIGTLFAVSAGWAAFPRLASLEEDVAHRLTVGVFRYSVVLTAATSLFAGITMWFAIPPVLGSAFRGSIAPTAIILLGAPLFGGQWILGRSAAARGRTAVLSQSFLVSLVVMVALDLVLIPTSGPVGAAIASTLGSGAAVTFALWRMRIPLKDIRPSLSDISVAVAVVRRGRASSELN